MTTKTKPHNSHPNLDERGFDVTIESVIGRVEFEGSGEDDPHTAALKLIGQHGEAGTYTFPGPAENETCRVTVAFVNHNG